jgi:hypothetical protein
MCGERVGWWRIGSGETMRERLLLALNPSGMAIIFWPNIGDTNIIPPIAYFLLVCTKFMGIISMPFLAFPCLASLEGYHMRVR